MKKDFVFTSESVTEGHPDKLCDRISDAVLDRYLQRDPFASVNTQCAVAKGVLFIATRFSSDARIDVPEVAREVIEATGYRNGDFNADDCTVLTSLSELPPQPYSTLDERELEGADLDRLVAKHQATLFGFACRQTDELMPLPIWLAHRLARGLIRARSSGALPYLRPDGKTQVGVEYRDRRPHRVHSITLIASQQDARRPTPAQLRGDLIEQVVGPVFAEEEMAPDARTQIAINPDGPLVPGGPLVHSGLTGRKTAADTYGQYSRHSGAALSGKDPLRIDRVGAYAARHVACNVVAAGLADECELQLSYSVGLPGPVSVQVETFGTGRLDDERLTRLVESSFDLRLGAILKTFGLRHLPRQREGRFFQELAAYGHMGRLDLDPPWEQLERAGELRESAGVLP
jgi:S-adenosylmethionine synthetase